MRTEAEPARAVLVTGHSFGISAFEGIFSCAAYLDGLLEIPLMIGLDDARAGATVGFRSLGGLAAEQGVPYVATTDGRLTSLAGRIRAAAPDYLLVIGWSSLIPDDVLAIPGQVAAGRGLAADGGGPGGRGAFGCVGMHPTKLPLGRGQAPIPWTIIKGRKQTALSVFFLEAAADTGPVIAQYDLDVRDRETGASLFYRIGHAHFAAGQDLGEAMGARRVPAVAQDESSASRWPRRRPADGAILAAMTCQEADALVRSLLGPYPRAFITEGETRRYVRAVGMVPGGAGTIPFACSDGIVYLTPDPDLGA
ncbi:MAG TPA: formyltransferase family protein [Streptosporangiaceae bacterium]|jgi:methionyl-tRNA formyltransferase